MSKGFGPLGSQWEFMSWLAKSGLLQNMPVFDEVKRMNEAPPWTYANPTKPGKGRKRKPDRGPPPLDPKDPNKPGKPKKPRRRPPYGPLPPWLKGRKRGVKRPGSKSTWYRNKKKLQTSGWRVIRNGKGYKTFRG